jgi:hypothetical protein
MLVWPVKDPDEVLDYVIDWSARLAISDAISSSSWPDFPSGITKDSDTFDDATTTIWLSGGTSGESYKLTNRIVTSGGRTMEETVKLPVKSK